MVYLYGSYHKVELAAEWRSGFCDELCASTSHCVFPIFYLISVCIINVFVLPQSSQHSDEKTRPGGSRETDKSQYLSRFSVA